MIKQLSDEAIHKLTDHWNPLPSRLDGIAPEKIKFRMFQAVAREATRFTLEQVAVLLENYSPGFSQVILGEEFKKQALNNTD